MPLGKLKLITGAPQCFWLIGLVDQLFESAQNFVEMIKKDTNLLAGINFQVLRHFSVNFAREVHA